MRVAVDKQLIGFGKYANVSTDSIYGSKLYQK